MSIITKEASSISTSRRSFLRGSGKSVLSATAVAVLVGCESYAGSDKMAKSDPANDISILNVALGLEHEGIAAYQIGAQSGLLSKGVLDVAVAFQSDHKKHRDALVGTIAKLGGSAVAAKSLDDYATDLNASTLKNQSDILKLAVKLERGAASAYLGVIPSFDNPELSQVSGRLAADEVMHWTALMGALGNQLPAGGSGLYFG